MQRRNNLGLGIFLLLLGTALAIGVPIISQYLNIGGISSVAIVLGFIIAICGLEVIGIKSASLILRKLFLSRDNEDEKEINEIKQKVLQEPEKLEPVWDLGRAKLELYFDRNLNQISWIFGVSVIVMIVGFGFILFGISESFVSQAGKATNIVTPALLSGVSGIITEFIGATFLFLYRSTIQQATNHIKTLERINSVGMAVKILDTISIDSKQLQDETKAEIVKTLLKTTGEDKKEESSSTEKKPSSTVRSKANLGRHSR